MRLSRKPAGPHTCCSTSLLLQSLVKIATSNQQQLGVKCLRHLETQKEREMFSFFKKWQRSLAESMHDRAIRGESALKEYPVSTFQGSQRGNCCRCYRNQGHAYAIEARTRLQCSLVFIETGCDREQFVWSTSSESMWDLQPSHLDPFHEPQKTKTHGWGQNEALWMQIYIY